MTSIAFEQIAQDIATVTGLRASARIERGVTMALQSAFDIPVGLAVADVIDNRRRHQRSVIERNFRRFRMLDADNVIARIDVVNFTRHPARQVGEKIDTGLADVVQGHVAP